MKTYILLENIVFFSNHGVFGQEEIVGNEFIVNIKIEADLIQSCVSDELSDTISYASAYDIAKEEMSKRSQLLENVAYRIVMAIKDKYREVTSVEVKVSKRNPPLGGQLDCASILIIG